MRENESHDTLRLGGKVSIYLQYTTFFRNYFGEFCLNT